mgnify:CR=1 FL=1
MFAARDKSLAGRMAATKPSVIGLVIVHFCPARVRAICDPYFNSTAGGFNIRPKYGLDAHQFGIVINQALYMDYIHIAI